MKLFRIAYRRLPDIVSAYARQCSLTCFPEKSQLVIIRERSITPPPQIVAYVYGVAVHQIGRARILGLHVQANGRADYTVYLLSRQTKQILNMIRQTWAHTAQKAVAVCAGVCNAWHPSLSSEQLQKDCTRCEGTRSTVDALGLCELVGQTLRVPVCAQRQDLGLASCTFPDPISS
ncbi:hypothetical protein HPB51_015686 [Rhipicephalus microplus]|uniref:Tick transposon n=1 Tax=Rhipicephalus microplus TaxID=6941 RepID=A0A9J6D5I9_RHIMP|nr:hypothetical protein HPB51_015686 [Rhipicephalus microplus]